MKKPGIPIDIPGFGRREITTIVSDYTGTHSRGGRLVEGVHERLMQLGERADIHIISADSFGTAKQQPSLSVPHRSLRNVDRGLWL